VRDDSTLIIKEAILLPSQILLGEDKEGPFQAIRNPVGVADLTVNTPQVKQLRRICFLTI